MLFRSVVTQDIEESIALNENKKKEEDEKRKREREEEARKKRAEDEQARLERERLEKERAEQERLAEEKRKKEQAIKDKVANAFQGGAKQEGQSGNAEVGLGSQGSPQGNSTQGATQGSAGYGTFDLGGRGIRGSLPRPAFSVNESGIVVVTITVDEAGKVINAIVGQGTTTPSTHLRNAAINAAKKALFESKQGQATQTGTITYRFDSDN